MKENLISYRFAVIVISILLGSSAVGWIMSELLPPDFPERLPAFQARLGETAVRLILSLRLYDPFHSFWYRAVLALFFLVLLLCILTRWRRFLRGMFQTPGPSNQSELMGRDLHKEIVFERIGERGSGDGSRGSGRASDKNILLERTLSYLRRKGYRTVAGEDGEGSFFTAVRGRSRFAGNFLFHIGILVITAGGMIGSLWGGTAFVYGKAGDLLPLPGIRDSVLVRDFRLLTTESGELRDYISTVSVIGAHGDTLLTKDIEVNKPLRHEGLNIYQGSYYVLENEFEWARLSMASGDGKLSMMKLRPGETYEIEGTDLSVRAVRFLPDFRMGEQGPFSAGTSMGNPALEIEIRGGDRTERGWLFLEYPKFNSKFDYPVRALLVDIGPVFFTGLQIGYNPGEHVFLAGIALATVGLVLLFTLNYRVLGGFIGDERLVIAAVSYRWKVSFRDEFTRIGTGLEGELARYFRGALIDDGGNK
ncbi:MAG: cytochrome c biogenesis protein ResB [Candidatus Krumholzibacteria bacterium]|nr:cytochrome c biogenesis protein ResB [Candidatus Krumholzibacteria bacterium]